MSFFYEDSQILISPLIFLGFLVLGKLIDLTFAYIFNRITRRTNTDIDDLLLAALRKPIFTSVILFGLFVSFDILAPTESIMQYTNNILKTLGVLVWAIAITQVATILLSHILRRKGKEYFKHVGDIEPFLESISKVTILTAALLMVLDFWGVDITPLLASAGVVGFAVAFAAKDTISNLFGGLSVFLDQPYKVGDYVIIDNVERGEVVQIGMRSTRIRTRDNILLSVPNSIMATSKIVNETGLQPELRIRIKIGISYDSDIDKVEDTLLKTAQNIEGVLKDPKPKVRFRQFGDSALLFELLCWIKEPRLKGRTTHKLNSAIYNNFKSEGIVIPHPQLDVHLERISEH